MFLCFYSQDIELKPEHDVISKPNQVIFVTKGLENIMVWLKMSPQYSFFTKHPVSCYTTQTESPPGVLQYIQQCDSNSFSHLAAVLAFNNTIA